ncbi:colicin-like pore-forming protein, partial [Citrobacter freundii]
DAEKKKQAEEEQSRVVDSVKLVSDFYGDVTEKLGAKNASLAKELAESAKGKKLRNVNEALAAFEKHKSAINSKFSVQDREAIAKAIESVNKDALAKNLQKFSKAFGITSQVIDLSQLANAIAKGIRTGEWKDAMLKIESMAVGKAASMAVAFTFGFLTVTPLGIAVFALLMTVTGALINERMMEKMNKQLFNI